MSDIETAREMYAESEAATSLQRQAHEDDFRFARLGEQWPSKIKAARQEAGRPCLTINRMPSFLRQVTNQARQSKPGIRTSPVDNGADKATANVIEGIIRHIERASNAELAYDTAIDHSATGGFGFFQVTIEYAHPMSFDLEARIRRIANPRSVYWDANSTEFDASDWDYAFLHTLYTESQFRAEFGEDAKPVSFIDNPDAHMSRGSRDQIVVTEWWLREPDEYTLLMLTDNNGWQQAWREDDLPELAESILKAGGFDPSDGTEEEAVRAVLATAGIEVKQSRKVRGHKVVKRLMGGDGELDRFDWPGRTIPICPVWGDEVIVDQERHLISMIRDAKDPQTMLNYWRSNTTEAVALAPKAPWTLDENSLPTDPGERAKWVNAHISNYPYLLYNGMNGQVPRREPPASIPTGAMQEAQMAIDDMKSITGVYDASLGARSNETSGRAIFARQQESDVTNFHFIDNLNRAIAYAGRVLVDIIPALYSQRDAVRILGDDGKEDIVRLTRGLDNTQGQPQDNDDEGEEIPLYNLNTGTYDVFVEAGPSYASQREEARYTLTEIMGRVPGAAPLIGDIFARNLDFQGADELEERLAPIAKAAVAEANAKALMAQRSLQQPQAPGMGQQGPQGQPPAMAGQAQDVQARLAARRG